MIALAPFPMIVSIYLPWNRKEEAGFFYAWKPQLVGAPAGWEPLPREELSPDEPETSTTAVVDVRESLSAEQRVSTVEHTIDPGFVNHRRIETILGDDGRQAINRAIAALPAMPEWQKNVRIGHIYSDIMLTFCRVLEVPPLGRLVAERKGRLFCSTETLAPCKDTSRTERAVSRWRPLARPRIPVEFHYSPVHVSSDTLRSDLRSGGAVSIIAELHSATTDLAVFHPLVMGGPWLVSPDPRWKDLAAWWGSEFYENVIEDFDEFSALKGFPKPHSFEPMERISEGAFKHCLAEIIGGEPPKDWGGETSDFFTSHLHLAGRRVRGAFLLKGPARFSPMKLNNLGKNNDQIVRLSSEPADVLFVQHCHEIMPPVRATLRAFSVQPSRPRRYCLIDGRDSLWVLQAHGLYDKAVRLSSELANKPLKRMVGRGRPPAA
jgi:hypothetical protein